MKERIYISGAITGTNNFMERFTKAQKELEKQGYAVMNPAHANLYMPDDATYEEYMKVSFCLLDMCDSIYMLNGWEKSCGANREYGYALAKDKTIIFEQTKISCSLKGGSVTKEYQVINILEGIYEEYVRDNDKDYMERNAALTEAVKALTEIQYYRSIGTVEECREAMEKQRSKKPAPIDYEKYIGVVNNAECLRGAYWCPNCKHAIRSSDYCNDCGQAIDWSDTD